MRRWRTVAVSAAVGVLLLGVAALTLAAPVLWLVVDEAAVPPTSDLPSLPAGVSADHQGVDCGSGGCWREWTLSGLSSTDEDDDVAGALDIAGDGCAARSLLDRRQVCTSVRTVRGETRVYVQFRRHCG